MIFVILYFMTTNTEGGEKMKKDYQIRNVPRMFEEVTRRIVHYISEEQLDSGTKIPTERQLSDLLEVSRSSVREGLRILEMLNYLESRQGEGTFVSVAPAFLLPLNIIKKETEHEELVNYYQVAMLHAKEILLVGIDQKVIVNEYEISEQNFWCLFSNFLNEIGTQLKNTYYLELWNSIHQLLTAYDFYKAIEFRLEFETIYMNYRNQNKNKVEAALFKLIEARIN
jgi:GntR family transcriptional repressor for pyruvate dehydrogenase complex